MTPKEIAEKAVELRKEALAIPDPSYMNYKRVLAQYKQTLNDMLVLIRELAYHAEELRK